MWLHQYLPSIDFWKNKQTKNNNNNQPTNQPPNQPKRQTTHFKLYSIGFQIVPACQNKGIWKKKILFPFVAKSTT